LSNFEQVGSAWRMPMEHPLVRCSDEARWNALLASERDDIIRDQGPWVAGLDRRVQHQATHNR
jgi:hypothetical protein